MPPGKLKRYNFALYHFCTHWFFSCWKPSNIYHFWPIKRYVINSTSYLHTLVPGGRHGSYAANQGRLATSGDHSQVHKGYSQLWHEDTVKVRYPCKGTPWEVRYPCKGTTIWGEIPLRYPCKGTPWEVRYPCKGTTMGGEISQRYPCKCTAMEDEIPLS